MKLKSKNKNRGETSNWLGFLLLILVSQIMSTPHLAAQTFDSGSDGRNGALNLTLADADPDGIIIFDPQAMGLVPDENNAYHFTTINVGSGVTVKLRADVSGLEAPVIWLASGDVTIDGTLDLNGEDGHDYNITGIAQAAIAGPGGFEGGVGRREYTGPTVGQGPGGGDIARSSSIYYGGGGAGHLYSGSDGLDSSGSKGSSYGNNFLIPLLGGSGGAGGGDPTDTEGASSLELGAGGGAGGGAVLIASSTQIHVNGSISCDGGDGGVARSNSYNPGGGGSGGNIRLMSNILTGSGSFSATGGRSLVSSAPTGSGSVGRIRQEIFDNQFTGTVNPISIIGVPLSVFPKSAIPSVRVTRISGLSVPPNATANADIPLNSTGSFTPADVIIEEDSTITFEIAASDIPLGTSVNLTLYNGTTVLDITSTPLAGTLENSTATATVNVPSGFSRFTVEASW